MSGLSGGEALAGLAHELRTPLHAIRASADLILAGDAGAIGDGALSLVGDIADAARRLDRLVSLVVSCAAPAAPTAGAIDLLDILRCERVRLDPSLQSAPIHADRTLLAAIVAALREAMAGDDPSAEVAARMISKSSGRDGIVLGRMPAGEAGPQLAAICRWAESCLFGVAVRVRLYSGREVELSWELLPADLPG
jgi:signal transduction histidine kinase